MGGELILKKLSASSPLFKRIPKIYSLFALYFHFRACNAISRSHVGGCSNVL